MVRRRFRFVALLLAVVSGVLWALASAPWEAGWLGWIALAPLVYAILREPRPAWSALYALVCGLVFYGLHLHWIFHFGWMAYVALVGYMAVATGIFGYVAGVLRRQPLAPVLVAGAWVGAELLRGTWPWGGFAWGGLGTTQGSVPGVRWLAGAVGAYGLSFLCAFVAATIADATVVRKPSWGSFALVGVVLALFVVVDLAQYGRLQPGRRVRVAVVQGNVPRPARADQDEIVLDAHATLTRRLLSGPKPDVIVWPESALGVDLDDRALDEVGALAVEVGAPILAGHAMDVPGEMKFLNLVRHFDAEGRLVATYQKVHPVPFGEYVPVPWLRAVVSTLGQVPYDMVPGREPVVFDVAGVRIGTPICFESVFARDVRAMARRGAELIVASTNDASFERSVASAQHLAQTRMRALENRQWVIQAAISGQSAVVAPDGRISHRTQLFEAALVRATVRARPAASLYSRVGDLFAFGWAAGSGLAFGLYRLVVESNRRRKPRGSVG